MRGLRRSPCRPLARYRQSKGGRRGALKRDALNGSPLGTQRVLRSAREGKETSMTTGTPTRTDEQIQREVLDELKWDARVQPNEIGVAVKGGVVTLTGWVDTYIKKWA